MLTIGVHLNVNAVGGRKTHSHPRNVFFKSHLSRCQHTVGVREKKGYTSKHTSRHSTLNSPITIILKGKLNEWMDAEMSKKKCISPSLHTRSYAYAAKCLMETSKQTKGRQNGLIPS